MSKIRRRYSRIPTQRLVKLQETGRVLESSAVTRENEEQVSSEAKSADNDILPITDIKTKKSSGKPERTSVSTDKDTVIKPDKTTEKSSSKYRRYTLDDRKLRRDKARDVKITAVTEKKDVIESESLVEKQEKSREFTRDKQPIELRRKRRPEEEKNRVVLKKDAGLKQKPKESVKITFINDQVYEQLPKSSESAKPLKTSAAYTDINSAIDEAKEKAEAEAIERMNVKAKAVSIGERIDSTDKSGAESKDTCEALSNGKSEHGKTEDLKPEAAVIKAAKTEAEVVDDCDTEDIYDKFKSNLIGDSVNPDANIDPNGTENEEAVNPDSLKEAAREESENARLTGSEDPGISDEEKTKDHEHLDENLEEAIPDVQKKPQLEEKAPDLQEEFQLEKNASDVKKEPQSEGNAPDSHGESEPKENPHNTLVLSQGSDITSEKIQAAPGEDKGKSKKAYIACAAIAVIALAYGGGVRYYEQRFLPNTYVSGVNVGGMSAYEADAALTSSVYFDHLDVISRTGTERLDLTDADVFKVFESSDTAIKAQNNFLWPAAFFSDADADIPFSVTYDSEMLDQSIMGMSIMANDDESMPKDAYIDIDSRRGVYVIVPEEQGTYINFTEFKKTITETLADGNDVVDISEDAGIVYMAPEVTSGDSGLIEDVQYLNSLNDANVYLDLGAGLNQRLMGKDLFSMIRKDGSIDETGVREYVTKLAQTYNTYDPDNSRVIINHAGIEKTISTSYGWELDEDATYDAIIEVLPSAVQYMNADNKGYTEDGIESFVTHDIEAVWKQTAAAHGDIDYGYTYVEIDMGEQNVYVFVDGECVLETPCVTGKMVKSRMTPEGLYSIYAKQTNRVLTGYNSDGSIAYRSPVKFWMPFNGGIGLHDASWRSVFGGDLYVLDGSHGCINLPYSAASLIYELSYRGMPVICYY